MIEGVKPYAEYKESDIPWAPAIPSSWQKERAKRLFTKMQRPVRPEDDVVTCFRDGMVTLRKNRRLRGFTEATVFSGYQGIRKGDLVIHGMDAFAGAIGVSDSDGKGTPVYNVCKPGPGVVARYYAHTVREMSRAQWILALAKGIRERSTDFRYEMFGNQFVPLPPPEEQAAIVRFLDHANRKIDGFIRAKRKLIGLLNEQKQAIIHRAVTRGLHPDVPLKPSGIPWLGDIPKHWDVRPIKHWTKINARTLGEATAASFEFRYIDIGAVRTGRLVAAPEVMRFDRSPSRARRVLVAGDTIISTVRTYLKAVWFAGENPVNLVASTGFAVFSPLASVEPEYLSYVLQDSGFVDQVTGNSVGIAYPAIAESVLARLRIAIPPSRSEQVGIIVAIKDQTGPLNTAISRTEREIALMQEYRTRLTADLVTGKLDVREAAAQLPAPPNDAPAPDEPLEEIETELEETNDASN